MGGKILLGPKVIPVLGKARVKVIGAGGEKGLTFPVWENLGLAWFRDLILGGIGKAILEKA